MAYLRAGLLILTKDSTLVHYPELDEEVELIARGYNFVVNGGLCS